MSANSCTKLKASRINCCNHHILSCIGQVKLGSIFMPWKGKVVFSQALLWSASFAESSLRIREIILEEAVKPVANRNKLKRNCFLKILMDGSLAILRPFQQYFSHIRMVSG